MCSRACNQEISGRNMPGKICKTLRIHTPNLQLARFATLRASDGQVPPCGLDVRFFSDKHRTCPPVFSVTRRRKATLALKSPVDHFLRARRWLNLHHGNSDNPMVKSPWSNQSPRVQDANYSACQHCVRRCAIDVLGHDRSMAAERQQLNWCVRCRMGTPSIPGYPWYLTYWFVLGTFGN